MQTRKAKFCVRAHAHPIPELQTGIINEEFLYYFEEFTFLLLLHH